MLKNRNRKLFLIDVKIEHMVRWTIEDFLHDISPLSYLNKAHTQLKI